MHLKDRITGTGSPTTPQAAAGLKGRMLGGAETFEAGRRLADLFGQQIDQPNMASGRFTATNSPEFRQAFTGIAPTGYGPEDIGVLQNPPQYYGSRLVLPQTGGSYGAAPQAEGYGRPGRISAQGPVGPPDPNDPHNNGFPQVPFNMPNDQNALQQAVYGYLIQRGYPVHSGSGQGGGLPVNQIFGFGQR